ncbi:Histone-arginine methyltransferase CARM1 family protein [Trichuris suis]|nr:Histone-arginine methyltransferase CARM1 family protein [Trichuris suis]
MVGHISPDLNMELKSKNAIIRVAKSVLIGAPTEEGMISNELSCGDVISVHPNCSASVPIDVGFVSLDNSDYYRMGEQVVVVRPSSNSRAILFSFKNNSDANRFVAFFNNCRAKDKSKENMSAFSMRTDEVSATQYFQFYGFLSQQQNMMQDFVRTSTYQRAVHLNSEDFTGKVVLDVGAGSGILSFFAMQMGACRVYAVEASSMYEHCEKLVEYNGFKGRIIVVPGMIEDIYLPEMVDTIISEPMGYMLLNERMLESFVHARKFLKPGGKMYPSIGDLHFSPYSDECLYLETCSKVNFWNQDSFHGIKLCTLREQASKEYFGQPVVDTFHTGILMSASHKWTIDFTTCSEASLHEIEIPFDFILHRTGYIHGLAFWFEVAFFGSCETVWLSTAPSEPLTHWYQVRCQLRSPIFGNKGAHCTGVVLFTANKRLSYDVDIVVTCNGSTSCNTLDLKNPFFRYNGQPVQPPPGFYNTSPTDAHWSAISTIEALPEFSNGTRMETSALTSPSSSPLEARGGVLVENHQSAGNGTVQTREVSGYSQHDLFEVQRNLYQAYSGYQILPGQDGTAAANSPPISTPP